MTFDELRQGILAARRGRVENLVLVEQVGSTNSLARQLVTELDEEGLSPASTLVVALEQTAGRGRRGRRWVSPPGAGVYATLLVPPASPAILAQLPLRVPLALAAALDRHLGEELCRVKWPNDLLVGGRKIGGVLIEALSSGAGTSLALIGFGVNHGLAPDAVPGATVTSLATERGAAVPPLGELVWQLTVAVEAELDRDDSAAELAERYRRRSVHRPGDTLCCLVGGEEIRGRFAGFDDRGRLLLEAEGEVLPLAAGEVVE